MNHKIKGIFKWLDTFYGRDVFYDGPNGYIKSDPFIVNLGPGDEEAEFYKLIYDEEYKHLSVYDDIIYDINVYFQISDDEAIEIIQNWYSNKFNVIVDNAIMWR
jgi:hypothetical protein